MKAENMKETEIEKLRQIISRTDKSGNEKLALIIDFIYANNSTKKDVDYWEQRCILAEKCLEETPCDPDIHEDQIKAWSDYHNFIRLFGVTPTNYKQPPIA